MILVSFLRTFLAAALLVALLSFAHADEDQKFRVEVVAANPEAGFNFPYVIRTPNTTLAGDRLFLIVESNNTGSDDDYQNHIDAVISNVGSSGIGATVASELEVPLLIPVFPRSKREWRLYTHALDRDTMLLSNDPRQRPDLQLIAMVEDARSRLGKIGIVLHEKFALVGFSASGTFSNRFAFMHPDKLLAVVSGAVNAFPMLPVADINGTRLDYPLGIADIEEITGEKFKKDAWKAVPQMIFMGALDDNDAIRFDDAYSSEERQTIFECVGEEMDLRWARSQEIYLAQQPNASLTTYGQVGHWTDGRINGDIVNFIAVSMRRASLKAKKEAKGH